MPFRNNEPLAEERVWEILIVDAVTGQPTNIVLTAADIQIHKYGAVTWQNVTNVPVADGTQIGAWGVPLTQAELDTDGPIWIRVIKAGVRIYLDFDMVGATLNFGFIKGQSNAALRVLPFVAVNDANGDPSSEVIAGGDFFIKKYGGAWANTASAPVNVAGQDGAWEVPLSLPEISASGPLGWRVIHVNVRADVSWERVDDSAMLTSGGGGTIVSVTPPPTTTLAAASTDTGDKWMPIQVVVEPRDSDEIYIIYHNTYRGLRCVAYDPTNGWSPIFTGSTLVLTAPNPSTGADRYLITILPVGGWREEEFYLSFISGSEMAGAPVALTRWDRYSLTVEPGVGDSIFAFYYDSLGRWEIYGPEPNPNGTSTYGYSPFYDKTSSIDQVDPDPVNGHPRWEMQIIPRSGWQRSFSLELVTGKEMQII